MDVCRTVTPELRIVTDGENERLVACHLYEPAAAAEVRKQ
jgi:hypothetical protein